MDVFLMVLILAGGHVPYQCDDLGAVAPKRSTAAPGPIAALIYEAQHTELEALTGEQWGLSMQLHRVSKVDPRDLPVYERIYAQNAAWSIAQRTSDPLVKALAMEVVRKFSLPPSVLEALGSDPDPAVYAWLGERSGWTERRRDACGRAPLVHEQRYEGTRAFRPVESGSMRGLVHQLLALDTTGEAHLTPLVSGIEIRRGEAVDAPACVVEFDIDAFRAGIAGGLVSIPHEQLHETMFIRVEANQTMGCNGCHSRDSSSASMSDVPAADAAELLFSRETVIEHFATKGAAGLFTSAR